MPKRRPPAPEPAGRGTPHDRYRRAHRVPADARAPTARDHGQHHRAQGALELAGAAEPLIGLRKQRGEAKPPTPPTIAPSAATTTGDMPLRLDGGVAERATETLFGRICSVS